MKLDKSIARNVTKMTIHTSADTSDVKETEVERLEEISSKIWFRYNKTRMRENKNSISATS